MNFFELQEDAHRKTQRLRVLFLVAVVAEAAVIGTFAALFHGHLVSWAAIATLLVASLATIWEIRALRQGGQVIAGKLGARLIQEPVKNLRERQLLNVAEEIAIASGIRVPDIYVLDREAGINAFAAGFSMSDSVVVVTKGLLDTLNRDEIQGVLGHEFSHILNGDSALNTRMAGWIAGLVVIARVGKFIGWVASGLNKAVDGGLWEASRDAVARDASNAVGVVILAKFWLLLKLGIYLLGLAVYVIGYTGVILARLITASVARQREFLADASAVQFTRNPDGIASALDQINRASRRSLINHPYAESISHMFFGPAALPLSGWMSTHPSIAERIHRIDPGFRADPNRPEPLPVPVRGECDVPEHAQPVREVLGGLPPEVQGGIAAALAGAGLSRKEWAKAMSRTLPENPAALAGTVGDIRAARRLIDALPRETYAKTQLPGSACAIVLAVLLSSQPEIRTRQLDAVRDLLSDDLARMTDTLEEKTRALTATQRLPLIDLALPAIRSGGAALKEGFLKALEAVMLVDKRISPLEFAVVTLMRFEVSGRHGKAVTRFNGLQMVRGEALWLLSMMAYAGARASTEQERMGRFDAAFAAGAQVVRLGQAEPVARDKMTLEAAEGALSSLRKLAPAPKGQLVAALFACILDDGKIRQAEAELMRMVCAVLECPLPPLFHDSDAASV